MPAFQEMMVPAQTTTADGSPWWTVVTGILAVPAAVLFGAVTTGIGFGLSSISTRSPASDIAMALIVSVLAQLPTVGYWLVFFALGGPLLADVLKRLNIPAPRLLTTLAQQRRLAYAVISGLVLITILLNPVLFILSGLPSPPR